MQGLYFLVLIKQKIKMKRIIQEIDLKTSFGNGYKEVHDKAFYVSMAIRQLYVEQLNDPKRLINRLPMPSIWVTYSDEKLTIRAGVYKNKGVFLSGMKHVKNIVFSYIGEHESYKSASRPTHIRIMDMHNYLSGIMSMLSEWAEGYLDGVEAKRDNEKCWLDGETIKKLAERKKELISELVPKLKKDAIIVYNTGVPNEPNKTAIIVVDQIKEASRMGVPTVGIKMAFEKYEKAQYIPIDSITRVIEPMDMAIISIVQSKGVCCIINIASEHVEETEEMTARYLEAESKLPDSMCEKKVLKREQALMVANRLSESKISFQLEWI